MESHQELGNRLELFFIDETSPGSIFWKPRGALLFNNLIKIMRDLYDRYGYTEVVSPNIFDKKLWEMSGHWEKYRENMFLLENIHHDKAIVVTDNVDVSDSKISASNESPDVLVIESPCEKRDNSAHQFAMKAMNCISGDAIISLADNTSVPLLELSITESDVIGYDKKQKGLVRTKKINFLDQGEKKCIELTFIDGRKLKCTPDHQILTEDG